MTTKHGVWDVSNSKLVVISLQKKIVKKIKSLLQIAIRSEFWNLEIFRKYIWGEHKFSLELALKSIYPIYMNRN